MDANDFLTQNPWILISQIWTIPLKGLALWVAARREKKAWFIVFLLVHTLGALELIYLLFFEKYYQLIFNKINQKNKK